MSISTTGPRNFAAEKFNVENGSQVFTGIPRSKFQFSVDFILNPQVTLEDESFGRFFTFDRVSSVGLPDFDYSLVRLNQYNRPRFVPTRLETQPITIIFYDTKDNQFAVGLKTDANPAKYWLVGDENYNIGINSTAPTRKLDVAGDVKVGVNTSQGVILTSPNGTEYRLTVDNSGTLTAVTV